MSKLAKALKTLFKKLYKILDEAIITPISRAIYFLFNKLKNNPVHLEKFLNRPIVLVYVSLILAVTVFFLVDSQVITLVETEAEILASEPVNIIYNKEAYVVEGLVEHVDVILTGRKSSLYLAKQLGEHEVVLDLSDYEASNTPRKVALTYNQSVGNISYKLDPAFATVVIKKKVSEQRNVSYELLNEEKLNERFSISNVTLNQSQVVVKGSEDTLAKIATVKALIDLSNNKFTEAITYDIDNIPMKAYDSNGNVIDAVEIVPTTIGASISFSTYKATVPLVVSTTGDLVAGKAISTITINGKTNYTVDIYGEKEQIDKITSVPVSIDINGRGNGGAQTYTATINKPNGVRSISERDVKIVVTFGEEKQKTIEINDIRPMNLGSGLNVNRTNADPISIQVKGVQSVIDTITSENISAYIDLNNYGAGQYDVDIHIDENDPRVKYVVTSQVNIVITNS
ncbi:MAG: hypothetical protein IJ772_01675 [Bacilli bacterium]|nr:hypothetical protein [Bacilli bacterium]MBR1817535.1 hypothetical protein [Bacilli bacterium]